MSDPTRSATPRVAALLLAMLSVCCTPDAAPATVQDPPDPPLPPSVVHRSDWGTATGDDRNLAHRDGGAWSHAPGSQDVRSRVLEVVPGSQADWTLTKNVLRVEQHGPAYWGFVEEREAIPPGVDYYLRFYVRVGPGNSIPNNHPVKADYSSIQAVFWAAHNTNGSSYRPFLNLMNRNGQGQGHYHAPAVPQGAWHRFEFHVEVLDQDARFRIWPRVFDVAGNPVADASDYMPNRGNESLAQFYERGGYNQGTSLDLIRRLTLGYEGTAGTPDLGEAWYYAAVEVRTDTWPGPVGGP